MSKNKDIKPIDKMSSIKKHEKREKGKSKHSAPRVGGHIEKLHHQRHEKNWTHLYETGDLDEAKIKTVDEEKEE